MKAVGGWLPRGRGSTWIARWTWCCQVDPAPPHLVARGCLGVGTKRGRNLSLFRQLCHGRVVVGGRVWFNRQVGIAKAFGG